MPRKPLKTLQEQLIAVNEEINKTKQILQDLTIKKSNIEKQIEEKDMHDAYNLLKTNGITVEELAQMLNSKK